ncbi:MAG TPA: clostripain-related cysteine peptidase [Lachnospiraceae bacterium]|nr:clostripain-related cysteine peptidase [Lachnospiraceae bacterium]
MKKLIKWILIILAVLIASFLLLAILLPDDEETSSETDTEYTEEDETGFGDVFDDIDEEGSAEHEALAGSGYSPDDTWAVYLYLCGSDLESEDGAATSDIMEMLEVELPENVQVVIETGGAYGWQNDWVDPNYLERYVYSSNGMELIEQQSLANMGDPDTLHDFLTFCKENYPADHQAVLFWNHGGGSVAGVAFDENYNYDSLTLDEMYDAFSDVYEVSINDQPFELVGFDACLMATIDTAFTFMDVAKFMVASEETEPGNGWYYTGWLQELADHPEMNGAQLGKAICDSYVEGCEMEWTEDSVTLSVTDLSAVEPLIVAYDNVGKEALRSASEDDTFITEFARSARSAENYGGNSKEEGYTNMVDLGDLVKYSEELLPETSADLLNCLEQSIVYKVNGPYRSQSTGLSCYHSYNADEDDYYGYTKIGASEPFKYLYGYEISGALTAEGQKFIEEMGYESLPEIATFASSGLEDYPIILNEEGYATLDIGAETANMLQAVYFQLSYVEEENDISMLLGRDNNLEADWDNGVFSDNFDGYWGAIDGHFVYMELVDEKEDYNLYTVPILLNGEEYNLQVAYNFTDEAYKILGARGGVEDSGMSDKELIKLKAGDEITTLLYGASYSGDDDYVLTESETFTVTDDTKFEDQYMGDGEFLMMFEMVDMQNQSAYYDVITFYVEGDEIITEVYE